MIWKDSVKITVLIILLDYIVARGTMREENDSLKCQIEAYKNELEMMKAEKVNGLSEKDSQLKILQQAMQGMQQVGGTRSGGTLYNGHLLNVFMVIEQKVRIDD